MAQIFEWPRSGDNAPIGTCEIVRTKLFDCWAIIPEYYDGALVNSPILHFKSFTEAEKTAFARGLIPRNQERISL